MKHFPRTKRSACALFAFALLLCGCWYALAGEAYTQSQFRSAYELYGGDLEAVVSNLDDDALAYLDSLIAAEKASRASAAEKGRSGFDAFGASVWLSATGSKYHSINDCGNMNPKKATEVTLAYAKQLGMEPCRNCDPPK